MQQYHVTTNALFYLLRFIPESIVWLSIKGRQSEAFKIIKRVAKFNRNDEVLQLCNSHQMLQAEEQPDDSRKIEAAQNDKDKVTLGRLMRNRIMRKHLLSMICVW